MVLKLLPSRFFTLILSTGILALSLPAGAVEAPAPGPPGPVPSYSAVLIKNLAELEAVKEFDCLGRVTIYLTWYNVPGTHRVTALWFNPQGEQQDAHDLDFEGGREVTGWLALEFLNITSAGNPMGVNSAATKFNGQWKVKLLLDGRELETKTFKVKCG